MKRWLVAGLLGLALLIFLSPGVVGILAERSLKQQLEQDNAPGTEPVVRQLDFARGWFASDGRHRVPISDTNLARFVALLTPGAGWPEKTPALIIETRLDHGLVPFGSAASNANALVPALAAGVSTLQLELADGSVLPVPGVLYSRIGLTGSATFRYELPPGNETRDTLRLEWQSSDISFGGNVIDRELSLDARFDGAMLEYGWQRIQFSSAKVTGISRMTPYGIPTGNANVRIADVDWSMGTYSDAWDLLDATAVSEMQGNTIQSDLQLSLLGFETADGPYDIELVAKASDLSAELLAPIIRALQFNDSNPQLAGAEPYPGFDIDLRRLLSAGATLEIDGLQLRTRSGDGLADIRLSLPELDEVATWPGLVLALAATADIEVQRTRVEAPSLLTDQLRLLVASGVLVLDGDVYRLKANLSKGKVIVNGAPMVIPPEWLQ